ncbi:MAG: mevalonate kinase [Spirochaetia bacterium]
MGGVGRSSGKLILFGEHAAVYGHPAVGVSLPEGTTVRFDRPLLAAFQDAARSEWELGSIPREDQAGVRAILSRLENAIPQLASRGRCAVRIESRVARNVGFGSSAALCGAFARAALALAGAEEAADREPAKAWALAHDAERIFHGTPSGVDTGLSLLGGTCVLRPRPPGLPEYRRVPSVALHLVVGAVPRRTDCAALIAGLGARLRSGDAAARASVDALGRISAEAAEVLSSGAAEVEEPLGELAGRAMDQLRALSLGTPELDRLLEAARAAGARGGKLSGAGGGGAFFAVAGDRAAAARIASRIRDAAAEAGIALTSSLRLVQI